MRCALVTSVFLALASAVAAAAWTSPATAAANGLPDALVVGTKPTPPFAMKADDGSWQGLSIDLWNEMMRNLGVTTRYVETDLPGLFDGVRSGRFDAAVAAVTVTSDREAAFDFTHTIYSTGLAMAVRAEGDGWLAAVRRLASPAFLKVVGSLLGLLLIVGFAAWLFERRRNAAQFGGRPIHGLGSGLWWAAVTMTTVGYGDKAPATLGGRIVALVWMFAAIIIISSFTAAITSSLTVTQLGSSVGGPDDLPRLRVATVSGSTSAAYLDGRGIAYTGEASPAACLEALAQRRVDAVVYDAPILRYLVRERDDRRLRVLPYRFERQDYAILLPEGSALREPLNRALLAVIQTPWWTRTVQRYLGK